MMNVIVDYNAGNLRSVETASKYIGVEFTVSSEPETIRNADRLVFPGVGEAKAAMEYLGNTGIGNAILDFYKKGNPLLGICLGSQIVLTFSEESSTACLGIVEGKALLFPGNMGLKVPHMGWNQVTHKNRHEIFEGIPENSSFYFVHSYYPNPDDYSLIIGETEYGLKFAAGIGKDNLVSFQFHPEKSGPVGLKLLQNFFEWKPQ
jgi:imidazole glycerol-phosphate synthase subunit HisH